MLVRRALALGLVVPLLLAGCSEDEPEPKMPDPTTPSPTATVTESETPEVESAEEFIRRWVEVGDEMQVTGETEAYDAITPRCRPCQSFVRNVKQVYGDGGSAEFSGSRIARIDSVGKRPPTFDLTKDIPDTVIREGDGEQRTLPGGRTTLRVTLGKVRGEWVVMHFGIL